MSLAPQIRLAGILLGVAACSSGGTTDNGNNNGGQNPPQLPGGTPVATANIDVLNNYYAPNSVLLAVNGTVTWNWVGDNGHSVTSTVAPTFSPTAPVSYPPKSLVVTFTTTGDYRYFCLTHGVSDGYGGGGSMVGEIFVR